MTRVTRFLALTVVLLAGPHIVLSQNATAIKPVLTKADYNKFESINGTALSADGKWTAYVVNRGERIGNTPAPATLHYRALGSDSEKTVAGASAPTFTNNSRWLIYPVTPANGGRGGRGGRGAAATPAAITESANAPANPSVGVVDLSSGTTSLMQ